MTTNWAGRVGRASVAAVAGCAVAAGALLAPAGGAAAGETPSDRTSALEAARVDRVKIGRIAWAPCPEQPTADCATVRLPLDYDRPDGPKVAVGVARVRAAKPARKIGTLFVNPGGPGGSAVGMALRAPTFLGQQLLDRFDVVGVDPRGVNTSEQVRCFRTTEASTAFSSVVATLFPTGRAEEKVWLAAGRRLASGCASTGQPLAGSMSTAEVVRDMDVVRRALGERKLTFLGFSYGTVIGQYYANMFPDRVRAIALDGVVDPRAWVGAGEAGRRTTTDDRIRSADGAWKAFSTLLDRCDEAGPTRCGFATASGESSREKFARLAARVKASPLLLQDPASGATDEVTSWKLVGFILLSLYEFDGGANLMDSLEIFDNLPSAASAASGARTPSPVSASLMRRLAAVADQTDYDNSDEARLSVTCSDTNNPADPRRWVTEAARADRRAPYFGAAWVWNSVGCASSIWKARDEDRYTGPWTRRTAAPLLFVGNYFDPATSYDFGAVPAARLVPNSRLLSSDSWGHTAFGTSACVTDAMVGYLLRLRLPAAGTVCHGPQPFTPAASAAAGSGARAAASAAATAGAEPRPAPVVPFGR